jgi:hypothetical protein
VLVSNVNSPRDKYRSIATQQSCLYIDLCWLLLAVLSQKLCRSITHTASLFLLLRTTKLA